MCAYYSPYLDEAGLHIPTYNDILEKRLSDAQSIYGQDIYLGIDSADYQSISVEALALYEAMQAVQLAYNQSSPATAIGVGLSNLVQLNGVIRKAASYSTCDVTLTGTTSATIINGVIKDKSGNNWSLPTPITLQSVGGCSYSLIVTATCQVIGEITALAGDLSVIVTPTTGWISVTNATAAIPGIAIETDSQLRQRQSVSVAFPSQTMLVGTIAGIAALSDVTRYKVYENPTNSSTFGDSGVPFQGAPVHSITAIVEGGTIADIAQVIYNNRGLGCYTDGDIITDIADPDYGTVTPIRFYRPIYVPIYVELHIKTLTGWYAGKEDVIKEAISDYINSLEISDTVILSSVAGAAIDSIVVKAKPSFSIYITNIGLAPSPLGTSDIAMLYNKVASCTTANIIIRYI